MIDIKNLTKSYRQNTIFEHVNLTLEDGKIYFILGKNGVGKTTFLKCLLHLENYKGSFTYDSPSPRKFFAVYDDIPLYENLNGYDNIRLFSSEKKNVREMIDRFHGLPPTLLRKKVQYYSLGEKKKVLIMAALLADPQYLILDEIANGLDIDSLDWLKEQLLSLKKKCLILVTGHYLEFYEKILDEVLTIHEKNICLTNLKGANLYDQYQKLSDPDKKGTFLSV